MSRLYISQNNETTVDKVADAIDKAVHVHLQARDTVAHLYLPPGCEHLASGVQRLREDFACDQSVVVMMKHADPCMLGSRCGLAVLEDQAAADLNPNVTLELAS